MEQETLPLCAISTQVKFLLGKVLTIIDASISDKAQNKAIKDLIKDRFYSQLDWIRKLATKDYGEILTTKGGERMTEVDEEEISKN